ncbi:MAG: hypothetical protein WDM90_15990 [Ferruginibacter sp.]
MEHDESREVYRILRTLTQKLSEYAPLLKNYHDVAGEYDFIRAKAAFGAEYNGNYPLISDRAHLHLVNAYHPLLFLYNARNQKPTIPVNLTLNDKQRILVISGPNAGVKRYA